MVMVAPFLTHGVVDVVVVVLLVVVVVVVLVVLVVVIFVRQPDSVGTALRFTAVLFYQCIFLRRRADDAHQICTPGSVRS